MNEVPESKLVEKVLNGDLRAFRDIVERMQPMVYSVSYRFLQNIHDAEDAVQEVFIRLWKNMDRYDGRARLSTWVYRIAVNLCLDKIKSNRSKPGETDISPQLPDLNPTVIEDIETREKFSMIHKAASRLTPSQQSAFILRDLEGLTVKETCVVLEITETQLKSNLYLARKRIRELLLSQRK